MDMFFLDQIYIKSPLNYTGGKYKLLPQILPLFPKNINTFVDLFAGGANVGINSNSKNLIINDNLIYLIDLYEFFYKSDIFELISKTKKYIQSHNLSWIDPNPYLKLRREYNTKKDPFLLFILICYSFNHQIRFNNTHEFNVPFGKERSKFNECIEKNLSLFIRKMKMKSILFSKLSFEKFDTSALTASDFVYCDPPYLISTAAYNDGKRGFTGWGVKEECMLFDFLDSLNARHIRFALSNILTHKGAENTLLKKWLASRSNYCVFSINKDYSNASYHLLSRDKSQTQEILVTNYTP